MSCLPQAVPVSASCPNVTANGAPSWSHGRQTRVTVRAGQSAKALRRERKPEGQREGESGAEGGSRRVPERAARRAFSRKEVGAAEGSVQRRPRWDRCPRALYREQTAGGAAAAGESQRGAAGAPGWGAGPGRKWSSSRCLLKEELPGGSCGGVGGRVRGKEAGCGRVSPREAAGSSGSRWRGGPAAGRASPLGPVQDLGYLACSCVSLGPHTALRLFLKNVLPIFKNRDFFFF